MAPKSETVVLSPVRLVNGLRQREEEKAGVRPEEQAACGAKLLELRMVAATNVGVEQVDQTVASVIEHDLTFAVDALATSTQEIRFPYLQSFAEMHGWRKVADYRPSHMREWFKAHPRPKHWELPYHSIINWSSELWWDSFRHVSRLRAVHVTITRGNELRLQPSQSPGLGHGRAVASHQLHLRPE